MSLCAPLLAIFWRAGGAQTPDPADWAIVRFTIGQALVSAAVSVVLAIPVARALARRRFPGRAGLITLLGAPFILPTIVAILGLLAIFGRNGTINQALVALGLAPFSIYGLHGIVMAHVFFNLPLAARMFLQGWLSIPTERFRLAAALGMGPREIRRFLEWPMLRAIGPGAFFVVFALCLSSFAVALTLGGGPRATTLELAIYQAFRFDFDLARAAVLAVLQIALVGGAGALVVKFGAPTGEGAGLDRSLGRWDRRPGRVVDTFVLLGASLFLLAPLGAIAVVGVPGVLGLSNSVVAAAVVSVVIALCASALLVIIAVPIAIGAVDAKWLEMAGLLGLAISPLALGTGLFLLVHPFARPADWAMPVTIGVNAVMALPFALRVMVPEARRIGEDYGRLADALGLAGWSRVRWLYLPRLRRVLGFAAGLTAALSVGDLGVVALFADPDWATLPLQMYRLMGAYRMDAAAGAGVLLLALSLLLFWIFDRGGRINADP